jgi:pentapeptide MXKDX repeat protein
VEIAAGRCNACGAIVSSSQRVEEIKERRVLSWRIPELVSKYMSCSEHIVSERSTLPLIHPGISTPQEPNMKKAILVAACVAGLSAFTAVGASAQTTGPAAQDTMKTNDMSKDGMKKDGMETKGMSKDGMAKDSMSKDGMAKDMSKDGSPKADTMKKGN